MVIVFRVLSLLSSHLYTLPGTKRRGGSCHGFPSPLWHVPVPQGSIGGSMRRSYSHVHGRGVGMLIHGWSCRLVFSLDSDVIGQSAQTKSVDFLPSTDGGTG